MRYERIIADLVKVQMGLTQAGFAALLAIEGLVSGSFTRLQDPEKRLSAANEGEVLRLLFISRSWAYGDDDQQWTPRLLNARAEMRRWAKGSSLPTPDRRLAGAWEQIHALLPDFEERIWCGYCRMVTVTRKEPYSSEYLISLEPWRLIMRGKQLPTDYQMQGAAHLTGIPWKWFDEGDASELEGVTSTGMDGLSEYLRTHNLTPEEALTILSAQTQ